MSSSTLKKMVMGGLATALLATVATAAPPAVKCPPGQVPTPQPTPRTTAQKVKDVVMTAPKSASPLGVVTSLLKPTKLGDATICSPAKKK